MQKHVFLWGEGRRPFLLSARLPLIGRSRYQDPCKSNLYPVAQYKPFRKEQIFGKVSLAKAAWKLINSLCWCGINKYCNPSTSHSKSCGSCTMDKRRECYSWRTTGLCRFGNSCRYAHDGDKAYKPPDSQHRQWSNAQVCSKEAKLYCQYRQTTGMRSVSLDDVCSGLNLWSTKSSKARSQRLFV